MEHVQQHHTGGVLGTIFTMFSLIYGMVTAHEIAYVVTIFAGITTTAYTIWKWRNEYRTKRKYNKQS